MAIEHPLACTECGILAPPDAPRWHAYLVGISDELDDEEMVAVYCPECAEREFGSDAVALSKHPVRGR